MANVDASAGSYHAKSPGIALDGHPVRHWNGRRSQLQRGQLGREKEVADALIETRPNGLFLDWNTEGKVNLTAVDNS